MEKAFGRTIRYIFGSFEGQLLGIFSVMLFSIVYSMEFLTSQAMFFLAGVVLFEKNGGKITLRKGNMDRLRSHGILSPFWLISIPFFLVLISLLWSENIKVGFRWIQLKLPFIVFPLLFMMISNLRKELIFRLVYFLLFLMGLTCIPVLYNYLVDYDAMNLLLSQGQHIPVPSNHIRFSMLMALAILSGGYLFKSSYVLKYKQERWLIGVLVFFLLLMIHVLSVRTGLALLYGMFLFFILAELVRKANLMKNIALIVVLIAGPFIAFKTLPSLQSKINYSLWDYGKYKEGRAENYSDSERIISIMAGMEIYRQSSVIGVGAGDLKDELRAYYTKEHPKLKMKLPHNQFVTVAASYGLVGLLFFLISIFSPLVYKKNYMNLFFLAFNLFVFGSMLFESTLDTNYGITIYLVFLLIGLKVLDNEPNQI